MTEETEYRLEWSEQTQRWYVGQHELHCGDTFEIFDLDEWVPVRIEYSDGWYLAGMPMTQTDGMPSGLRARRAQTRRIAL